MDKRIPIKMRRKKTQTLSMMKKMIPRRPRRLLLRKMQRKVSKMTKYNSGRRGIKCCELFTHANDVKVLKETTRKLPKSLCFLLSCAANKLFGRWVKFYFDFEILILT